LARDGWIDRSAHRGEFDYMHGRSSEMLLHHQAPARVDAEYDPDTPTITLSFSISLREAQSRNAGV